MSFFSSVIVNGEFLEFKVFDTLFHVLDSIHEQRKIVKKISFRYISRVLYFAFSMHEPWRKKQTIQDLQKVSFIPGYVKKRKFDVCHDCNGLLCTSYNWKHILKIKKKFSCDIFELFKWPGPASCCFLQTLPAKPEVKIDLDVTKKWMITIAKQNVAAVDSQTGVS